MRSRRVRGTLIVGLALGVASMMPASTALAVSETKGLVPLSLQGVGSGALDQTQCTQPQAIACKTGDTCDCLNASYTLVGDQGFKKGKLEITLSVDTTPAQELPIADSGVCVPAAGTGTLTNASSKVTVLMNISGLECDTTTDGQGIIDASYVITSGVGKVTNGTGAINGSVLTGSGGGLSQIAVTGTAQ
jgi:hypothetical protein